jgi:cyclic-di-GMP-binding protein
VELATKAPSQLRPAGALHIKRTLSHAPTLVLSSQHRESKQLMAQQNSFDIVSEVDRAEVMNAVNQCMKEVRQRFDFKDSKAAVELEEKDLVLSAEDETKLRNMNDILQQKLVRRGVPLKALSYGDPEPAAGGTVRQRAQIQQGIPQEKSKEIVRFIKDSKARVQASIQGEMVRVSGKDRDTLQQVIASLKAKDFGINMQFTNYRSN